MAYRIMIVVEDLDYDPDTNPHQSRARVYYHSWIGGLGDRKPAVIEDYETALVIAEELTVHFTTTSKEFYI